MITIKGNNYEYLVVETDEEIPTVIAEIKGDFIDVQQGYVVRLKPCCTDIAIKGEVKNEQ